MGGVGWKKDKQKGIPFLCYGMVWYGMVLQGMYPFPMASPQDQPHTDCFIKICTK